MKSKVAYKTGGGTEWLVLALPEWERGFVQRWEYQAKDYIELEQKLRDDFPGCEFVNYPVLRAQLNPFVINNSKW